MIIRVKAVGDQGDGISTIDGRPAFIPFALPGEDIDMGSGPRIVTASMDRVQPSCPHHGNVGQNGCGGCRMQPMREDVYRRWKRDALVHALRTLPIAPETIHETITSPPYSRRRVSLSMERVGNGTLIGINARGTRRIVDMQTCLILKPQLLALLPFIRALRLLRPRETASCHMIWIDNDIELMLERKRTLDMDEREALATFAERHDLARISWRMDARTDSEPVVHRRQLVARYGEYRVVLPPGGFLQATAEGEAALRTIVLEALPSGGRLLDLFAGSGTFSVAMASRGRVHAVEGNAGAVRAMCDACIPGLTAERRDLFREPLTGSELSGYDAVVFDPPHAGAKDQSIMLAQSSVPLIIAVSCNPISFARDAGLLLEAGYELQAIVPVDQFLWSAEIELAGVFTRRRK